MGLVSVLQSDTARICNEMEGKVVVLIRAVVLLKAVVGGIDIPYFRIINGEIETSQSVVFIKFANSSLLLSLLTGYFAKGLYIVKR